MGAIASQITSLTIVYSIVYSDADQRKHQSSVSLAFVRVPGEFPAQMASYTEMFPFDDVIMQAIMENRNRVHVLWNTLHSMSNSIW